MEYVLTSFHHESNVRKFLFDGVDADRKRTPFTVCVDLGMIRKYEISLQELPLLCRYLLEGQAADAQIRVLTFTEADMQDHADRRCGSGEEGPPQASRGRRTAGVITQANRRNAFHGSSGRAPLGAPAGGEVHGVY